MILSANGERAKRFISNIRALSLNEKLDWTWREYNDEETRTFIRMSPGEGPNMSYIEVEEGIYCHIDGYHISLYRADAGTRFVMHIKSTHHQRQRLVGESNGDSVNQDLSIIFRKVSDPDFPETNERLVPEKDLTDSLDKFFTYC